MAAEGELKVYSYRWIVLAVFMAVVLVNQLAWITFAPITGVAAKYYGVSDLSIGLLSMSFMLVFIFVSIPASWTIDTHGFRVGVGIGAALTGIFGMLRGLGGDNYTLVLISQIGIAVGQPFVLNALTKVAARWFPLRERATATGLGTLAMYFGIVAGMVLTPILVLRSNIAAMLTAYGVAALLAAILFLIFSRERPPTPANPPDQEERSLVFDGLKHMLRMKDFILLLLIFFFGLGVFNSVTTWIEEIFKTPRIFDCPGRCRWRADGFRRHPGGCDLAHAVRSLPAQSAIYHLSLYRRDYRFSRDYLCAKLPLAAALGICDGIFLLSAGPIGFQYGAEITFPDPEGTSNGMLLLMGQISGILFIIGMDSLKDPATGSMTASLVGLAGLLVVGLLLSTRLKESTLLSGQKSPVSPPNPAPKQADLK